MRVTKQQIMWNKLSIVSKRTRPFSTSLPFSRKATHKKSQNLFFLLISVALPVKVERHFSQVEFYMISVKYPTNTSNLYDNRTLTLTYVGLVSGDIRHTYCTFSTSTFPHPHPHPQKIITFPFRSSASAKQMYAIRLRWPVWPTLGMSVIVSVFIIS